MITPTLINNLQWRGYLLFMALNFSFIPLVYFFYPETSNLGLEEIDFLFTKEGNTGLTKILKKSQAVKESLKSAAKIDHDVERSGALRASYAQEKVDDHVEQIDDKAS
ncbi:hypothetical protein AC579_2532 [Pseudocercospora musae]|uniref:Major facilitator superfamily (MFS) profile domain-containing protein n=1 Tax=Pseudocercospora musae TaxID=113226 RepID=A0A139HZX2_9PEZI|nr:hypothetical protein AC579_2532 [Pseudocercospora musae]